MGFHPNPRYEASQTVSCPNAHCEEPQMVPHPRRAETVAQSDSAFCRKPYAMAYVQPQRWETIMCAEDALAHGTAFPSLVMPFLGKEACR